MQKTIIFVQYKMLRGAIVAHFSVKNLRFAPISAPKMPTSPLAFSRWSKGKNRVFYF